MRARVASNPKGPIPALVWKGEVPEGEDNDFTIDSQHCIAHLVFVIRVRFIARAHVCFNS